MLRVTFKILESKWTGTIEDSFFSGEKFDRNRILLQPEKEYSGRSSDRAYYVLGVDVGRKDCQTAISVIKVTPQVDGTSVKNLVNMFTFNEEHFEDQAIKIKKLYYTYRAKRIVIDGNGLGVGLMDYMVKRQIVSDDEIYPPFGVYGGTYEGAEQEYKKYRTDDTEDDAIYVIKANAPIDTTAYSIIQSQIESGKIKFLIDSRTAKIKLLGKKLGQAMTPEQRDEYLLPFTLTDILREELLNLREENEGINIRLKQANRRIGRDKFTSLLYGLYYIREIEDNRHKKKKGRISDFMFLS